MRLAAGGCAGAGVGRRSCSSSSPLTGSSADILVGSGLLKGMASHVKESLIHPDLTYASIPPQKHFMHSLRRLFVCRVPRFHNEELWAQLLSDVPWHGSPDTKASGNVVGRGQHSHPPDRHWFAAQRRVVPLLYSGIERVHVDVNDAARKVPATFKLGDNRVDITDGGRRLERPTRRDLGPLLEHLLGLLRGSLLLPLLVLPKGRALGDLCDHRVDVVVVHSLHPGLDTNSEPHPDRRPDRRRHGCGCFCGELLPLRVCSGHTGPSIGRCMPSGGHALIRCGLSCTIVAGVPHLIQPFVGAPFLVRTPVHIHLNLHRAARPGGPVAVAVQRH
eukprot:m.13938 g.13938  ORF g.13938 m.13938 type:complete len:332 (-) comp8259_c0_seq2:194-1189(-)